VGEGTLHLVTVSPRTWSRSHSIVAFALAFLRTRPGRAGRLRVVGGVGEDAADVADAGHALEVVTLPASMLPSITPSSGLVSTHFHPQALHGR